MEILTLMEMRVKLDDLVVSLAFFKDSGRAEFRGKRLAARAVPYVQMNMIDRRSGVHNVGKKA